MLGLYRLPFWSSLLIHVGLLPLTMVLTSVRFPTHRHLLAGVAQLDSEWTRFLSRFTMLIASLYDGDNAVPRSQGVEDYT